MATASSMIRKRNRRPMEWASRNFVGVEIQRPYGVRGLCSAASPVEADRRARCDALARIDTAFDFGLSSPVCDRERAEWRRAVAQGRELRGQPPRYDVSQYALEISDVSRACPHPCEPRTPQFNDNRRIPRRQTPTTSKRRYRQRYWNRLLRCWSQYAIGISNRVGLLYIR